MEEEKTRVVVKKLTPEMPETGEKNTSPVAKKGRETLFLAGGFLLVLIAGTLSGYLAQRIFHCSPAKETLSTGTVNKEKIKKGAEFGVSDPSVFKDQAIGVLRAGGVDGEGTHHLEREGGVSRNVYLTSSVVDLDQFVGRKVEVWGETFAAQKAGWLMDVGKLKVLD